MKVNKFDIAREQLITAVSIFFNQGNYSAVITLAGAANGILTELVKREGKQPFVDFARELHAKTHGYEPKRIKYSHHISNYLGITAHKHLSKDEPLEIALDIEYQAHMALVYAIADYTKLAGSEERFVKEFLAWAYKNMDNDGLIEEFQKAFKEGKL